MSAYRDGPKIRRHARQTSDVRLVRAYFRGTLGRVDMKRGRLPSGPGWVVFLAIWGAFQLIPGPWWTGVMRAVIWASAWARVAYCERDFYVRRRAIRRLCAGTAMAADLNAIGVRPENVPGMPAYERSRSLTGGRA